jgi:hypothetical protein
MSEIGTFNAANSLPGDLVKTLLGGLAAQSEEAVKIAAVQVEAQVKLQEQAAAMDAVGLLAGIGTRIDTVA